MQVVIYNTHLWHSGKCNKLFFINSSNEAYVNSYEEGVFIYSAPITMDILKIKHPKRNEGNRIFFIGANAANLIVQHIYFRSNFFAT